MQWAKVTLLHGANPELIARWRLAIGEDLKHVVQPILPLRDERGVEVFYKWGLTPWFQVTADLQVITPVMVRAERSLVLGMRARIDF